MTLLLNLVITQILFGMRDFGIKKIKHFTKARIISDGIPHFCYYQAIEQEWILILFCCEKS